jgi:hypothetical protein
MHLLRCFKSHLSPLSAEFFPQVLPHTKSWFYVLLLIGCFLCAVDFHAPFVALTVVAALTLNGANALWCVGILGLVHQILGRGIVEVQLSMAAVEWDLMVILAIGCVLVTTLFCKEQLALTRQTVHFKWWSPWVITAIVLSISFLIFEGLTMLFWIGQGGHGFTLRVLIHLFTKEFMWALSLTGLWTGLRSFANQKPAILRNI